MAQLDARQARILRAVNDRYISLNELSTQLSTDAERSEYAGKIPVSIEYDQEESAREAKEWQEIYEAENNIQPNENNSN